MNKKAIILFSAAVLLLSGCGSKGDKETTAATAAPTTVATTEVTTAATTAAETTTAAEETVKETESFTGSSKMEFSNNVTVEVDGYNLVEDTERTIIDGEECQKYYEDKDADVTFMIVYSVLADTEIIPQYMEDVHVFDYNSVSNEELVTCSMLSLSGGDKGTLVLYRSEDAYGTYFITASSSHELDLKTVMHDIADQIDAQDSSIVHMSDFSFADYYTSSGSTGETSQAANDNGYYWVVPEDWAVDYEEKTSANYIKFYNGRSTKYSAAWFVEPKYYAVDFLSGKTNKFRYNDEEDTKENVTVYDVEYNGETFHVIEDRGYTYNVETYDYCVMSDDGTKYVEIVGGGNDKLQESDILDILSAFLPE